MSKINPKTQGSGIECVIPQKGECPIKCEDCFFQSGRSYLEPLEDNLPKIPQVKDFVVYRINDGNDSNNNSDLVKHVSEIYPMRFYNTSIPKIDHFKEPVVLTVNPNTMTDTDFHKLDPIPNNLMFVRARANMWNRKLIDEIVEYYTSREVPVILTFMAYYKQVDEIPEEYRRFYEFRKRTLNSYHAITTSAWEVFMTRYRSNKRVYSCGKIEGEKGDTHCKFCGNCLREYFATKYRLTH